MDDLFIVIHDQIINFCYELHFMIIYDIDRTTRSKGCFDVCYDIEEDGIIIAYSPTSMMSI